MIGIRARHIIRRIPKTCGNNEDGSCVSSVEAKIVSAVTIYVIRDAQIDDPLCNETRRHLACGEQTPHKKDERGLIVRVAELDGTLQIFVSLKLRQRVLYLAHYTPIAGHPGITKHFVLCVSPSTGLPWRRTLERCPRTDMNVQKKKLGFGLTQLS